MATVPCFLHSEVERGPVTTFYPAFIRDGHRSDKKLHICKPGTRELVAAHATDWLDAALTESPVEDPTCTRCGQMCDSLASLSRFFCTVYIDGKTRRDYMAYYCPDCDTAARREFGIA